MTLPNSRRPDRYYLRGRRWLDARSSGQSVVLVFVILMMVYLPSATYDFRINTDAAMAAMPAWSLAEQGTLDLSAHREFLARHDLALHESREIGSAVYSGRNPGPIAWAFPFYVAASPWTSPEPFPVGPATVAAATAAALAMAMLSLVFRRLVTPAQAIVGALVAGTATTTWAVSSDALWTHGPAQLFIVAATLLMSRNRYLWCGLAFGGALLCRPDLALAAAAAGLCLAWQHHRVRPALQIAITSALGLLAMLGYSRALFDRWSVLGGYYVYEDMFLDNTVRGGGAADGLVGHVPFHSSRFARSLFDLDQGLFVYSLFLVLLLAGLPRAWRVAAPWVRAAALGGLAHFVAQVIANGWWGGDFFFGYRYPLEALTLWAPLLLLAWREHVLPDRARVRLVGALIAFNILWMAYGAVFEPYKG